MAKEGNYSRSWCRRGGHLEENIANSAQFLQLLTSWAEADSLPNISVSSCLFAGEKNHCRTSGEKFTSVFFFPSYLYITNLLILTFFSLYILVSRQPSFIVDLQG